MKRPFGFTLVELLIVCAIVCTLLGLSVGAVGMVRRHCIKHVTAVTRKFDDMARKLPEF